MLVQFTVNNFKSIKDSITFSMLPSSKDEGNAFDVPNRNYELLQSAIIYGANASGKSNFLKAFSFMARIVLNRDKVIQSTDRLVHQPFKLNSQTEDASSSFEMVFFVDEIKYRYGFELDDSTVYEEWLYADENGKESKLFYRDEEELYINRLKFKEGLRLKASQNQLFIWKCDQEGGEISASILQWFNRLNMIDGMEHDQYINYAMKQMEDELFKKELVALVKTADIGIEDIMLDEEEVSKEFIEEMPLPHELKKQLLESSGLKKVSLLTQHKKYDEDNREIGNTTFELDKEESKGTRKFFKMSAPILNTLREGKILIIDELDASLHPMLTKHLIKLFHNKEVNKYNAQLIFATHDTNLLHKSMFRRDQIWMSEKDNYGATTLYSLAQFKNVRKKEDFEKRYMQGKYGAIPYLEDFGFEVE
ncbi:abortive infection protein, putative [hydrothermal vent metagenome]|uniref:Abortive infection protein, putative n=1 Tax=hydrothermal vent metagenome TaxID=652676 RepID=A0A1W1C1R9_9ZZZZ